MVQKIYENRKTNMQSERKTCFLTPNVSTQSPDMTKNLMSRFGIGISEVI
jgi:hypothetical protein